MQTTFEKNTYLFLSAYRFFSYALAVMFIQVGPSSTEAGITDFRTYIILSGLGVYSLFKVFSPLRWRERSFATYAILVSDFLICIFLLVITKGLNSAFLLYALIPIMTAAILFEERVALALAASSTLILSISHLAQGWKSSGLTWFMQGHNLTLLIIYSLFCFVTATLTYRTNLNVRRRIERDAILEERRRLGREMHDGVAQSLSYLNLKMNDVRGSISAHNAERALSSLKDIQKVVQDTYDDVRESIDQLSVEAKEFPLMPALRRYTIDFSKKNDIHIRFEVYKSFPRLSPIAELQLLRIAQEALTNVRRHACASTVGITLTSDTKTVEMRIKDDGRGFVLPTHEENPAGYHGLDIIKERAEGLGGNLEINSELGKGTELKVTLPTEKVRL